LYYLYEKSSKKLQELEAIVKDLKKYTVLIMEDVFLYGLKVHAG